MSLQGKSLQIMTPAYGGIFSINYVTSLLQLVLNLQKYNISFGYSFMHNESLIPRARNKIVDIFRKKSKFTHAVFIDSDIGFDFNDILSMLEVDRDIVGAGCVKKEIRWDRVQQIVKSNGKLYSPDEMSKMAGSFVVNPAAGSAWEFSLGEPLEVKDLGTGLLMIKRQTFDKFVEAYPDRWYEPRSDLSCLPGPIYDFFRTGVNAETREYESEDYGFCTDCRAIGLKVWLCPWIKTTHIGSYTFVGDIPMVCQLMQAEGS